MRPWCFLLGLTASAWAANAPVSFDALLADGELWALSQDAFEKVTTGLPFRWTSAVRDSARAADTHQMTLFGRPIYEIVTRFAGEKLEMISVSFYARGDAGGLSEEKFKALLLDTVRAITNAAGVKHTVRGRDAANAVKAEGLVWQTTRSQYLLEYSFTREVKSRGVPFRAEFIRLEIRPVGKKASLLTSASVTRPRFDPAKHVKRDAASGDVWLHDVPMVDQGQKGYCVVASAERVMRYYGGDVDANELAQIANSDSESGTNMATMTAALKKVAARLKVKLREHEKMDVRDFLNLVRDYNRAAKRAGEREIPDPGPFIDVGRIMALMKPAVLKEARTKNPSDLSRFMRDVQTHVDDGLPLLWSVHLGFVKEPGLQQIGGGHMRLIIGYNVKTQEILYSDSWGAGHELKRMKADDAWTSTMQLMTIEPLS
jgi:hypothetical protein